MDQMDTDHPVIRLCVEGMDAEASGPEGRAKELFTQAWDAADDDFGRCVAAHYLARHQDTPQARLDWNLRCLELADTVGDERVSGFYPSLHVNLGRDLEEIGDATAARRHYETAGKYAAVLGDDGYGQMLREGIAAGLARTGGSDRT